jgi:acyl-CoA thioester hydrolase
MIEVDAGKRVGEARVRVRYAETDQMGVVYHSNYLIWFEVGRVELIRSMGLDYKRMEVEEGCGIAVVDVHVRYRAPARYDDELVVETRLVAARGAVIKFGYKVLRIADRALLCEGETVHVVVGKDMKKRCLPPKYAERFAAYLASHASDE